MADLAFPQMARIANTLGMLPDIIASWVRQTLFVEEKLAATNQKNPGLVRECWAVKKIAIPEWETSVERIIVPHSRYSDGELVHFYEINNSISRRRNSSQFALLSINASVRAILLARHMGNWPQVRDHLDKIIKNINHSLNILPSERNLVNGLLGLANSKMYENCPERLMNGVLNLCGALMEEVAPHAEFSIKA